MVSLIDLILPKICVGCKGEGSWLCQDCFAPLITAQAPSCADCGRLTADGRYCRFHKDDHVLKGLIFVGQFHAGTLREAVHHLKYNYVRQLARPLGQLLAQRLEQYPQFTHHTLVVPIPLHASRQARRGFNQAALLASALPYSICEDILVRYRMREPQAKLTHEKRKTNMAQVFGVPTAVAASIQRKTVLLVDDVATTGSTLEAAAMVLKKAGARTVWAAVIAKG